jgi:hypothetical protein
MKEKSIAITIGMITDLATLRTKPTAITTIIPSRTSDNLLPSMVK